MTKKKIAAILAAAVLVLAILGRRAYSMIQYHILEPKSAEPIEINVDFSTVVGDIKPLNGINNGPASGARHKRSGDIRWKLDATDIFETLEIPFVRTHDAEYPYGSDSFVDIHCIFPDENADVNDPASYHFADTDAYLAKIADSGAEIFYRLGESIDHSGKNLYNGPPADYTKWAQVCEHIIRHYNEGWADGYTYGIRFWEIWNEYDHSDMWTASDEEYFLFYCQTASYLKEQFPDLMIGGPAFTGAIEERVRAFLEYLKAYDGDVPLDFMSWHLYHPYPNKILQNSKLARALLDEYGYTDTLSILDEWNYIEDWNLIGQARSALHRSGVKGAAYMTTALINMQNSPVDIAMYYDGQYKFADLYCGLYWHNGWKKPGYYSFLFFSRLRDLGNQVQSDYDVQKEVYSCAAISDDGAERAILLVNNTEKTYTVNLRVTGTEEPKRYVLTEVNQAHKKGTTETRGASERTILLRPYETALISF